MVEELGLANCQLHFQNQTTEVSCVSKNPPSGLRVKRTRGTYNPAVSRERKHHSRVGSHGEEPAVPYTNHHETHRHHGSHVSKGIHENLNDWIPKVTRYRVGEILYGEEKRKQHEKAKERREADRRNDSDRCRPGRISSFLG